MPTARFLTALLPYFEDPKLAFVQSPQDFYNLESFEHERRWNGPDLQRGSRLLPGHRAGQESLARPFWCGTCALVRVDGVALRRRGQHRQPVTEDIHTTIRMYRKGWPARITTRWSPAGLAPDDATAYLIQRNRWALGAMQVLRRENPLFAPGLAIGQRLAFMTTLFGWFDSWRTLRLHRDPARGRRAPARCPSMRPANVRAPFFLFDPRHPVHRPASPRARVLSSRVLSVSVRESSGCRQSSRPPSPSSGRTGRRPSRSRPRDGAPAAASARRSPRILSVLAAFASSIGLVWFTATLLGSDVDHLRRSHGPRSARLGSWPSTSPSCWPRSGGSGRRVRRQPPGRDPAARSTSRCARRAVRRASRPLGQLAHRVRIPGPVDAGTWRAVADDGPAAQGRLEIRVDVRRDRDPKAAR